MRLSFALLFACPILILPACGSKPSGSTPPAGSQPSSTGPLAGRQPDPIPPTAPRTTTKPSPSPVPPSKKPPQDGPPSLTRASLLKLESPGTHGGFFAFSFSPDGKILAGGTGAVKYESGKKTERAGGEVILWDAHTGKLKQKLGTHGDSVTWLSYTGNGSLLFSGSRDNGVIKIWDLATGKPRQTIDLGGKYGQNTFYPLLARSLDGTTLVTVRQRETKVGKLTVNEGGDLAAWDTSTGKVRWNLEDSRVQGLTLSSDGKKVAGWVHRIDKWIPEGDDRARASGEKNQLVIWDSNTGKPEKTVDLESGFFQALAYLPGNQVLVFLHQSKVIFRDAATGTVQREIKLDTSRWAFSSFAFSPDGKTLARSWSDYVELANLETGAVGGLLTTKFPENLFQVAFSPDLKRVACTQQGPVVFDLVPAKP